ncbi:unnamed protein product, partial [Allacma fusca]
FGLGPIPWMLPSELLPADVRGRLGSIAVTLNWLPAFCVVKAQEFVKLELLEKVKELGFRDQIFPTFNLRQLNLEVEVLQQSLPTFGVTTALRIPGFQQD